MTEPVIVSNVIAIASLVSEKWLSTERQTDRQTNTHTPAHTQTWSRFYGNTCKDTYDFANNDSLELIYLN